MNLFLRYVIVILIIIGLLITLKITMYRICPFIEQYALTSEINLPERYGKGNWVLITGPSSGMGERFAYEFAERGFNIVLIGHTKRVTKSIKKKFKRCEIIPIETDFVVV